MNRLWKYLQFGYLVVAIIFFVEGLFKLKTALNEALIMFGFAIFITLIFIFKSRFRKKIIDKNKLN
ncbi:MAG TPA: hypothetical protein DDE71_02955 [Tenacibaculum sp.]|nr:hypothetical protein [Tenacibaculum sp.]